MDKQNKICPLLFILNLKSRYLKILVIGNIESALTTLNVLKNSFAIWICHKNTVILWHFIITTMKTNNIVRERILGFERGKIFFPSDFDDIATDTAIRQPLSRMA